MCVGTVTLLVASALDSGLERERSHGEGGGSVGTVIGAAAAAALGPCPGPQGHRQSTSGRHGGWLGKKLAGVQRLLRSQAVRCLWSMSACAAGNCTECVSLACAEAAPLFCFQHAVALCSCGLILSRHAPRLCSLSQTCRSADPAAPRPAAPVAQVACPVASLLHTSVIPICTPACPAIPERVTLLPSQANSLSFCNSSTPH